MQRHLFLTIAVLLGLGGPLQAQTDMRPDDMARLARFDAAAGDALLQALSGGAPEDVTQLVGALSGAPIVAFDETMQGEWNCRTLKLGKTLPLVVYRNFSCHFTLHLDGFRFEKRTGSQRTKGMIRMLDGRAIYLGVGFVAGQNPPDYPDLPADFRSDGSVQSQVAVFERVSATHARMMFPSPAVESDFDILELTR